MAEGTSATHDAPAMQCAIGVLAIGAWLDYSELLLLTTIAGRRPVAGRASFVV
jgi:hypothetical protein